MCENFRCPQIQCGMGTSLVEVWSPDRCCPYKSCGKFQSGMGGRTSRSQPSTLPRSPPPASLSMKQPDSLQPRITDGLSFKVPPLPSPDSPDSPSTQVFPEGHQKPYNSDQYRAVVSFTQNSGKLLSKAWRLLCFRLTVALPHLSRRVLHEDRVILSFTH